MKPGGQLRAAASAIALLGAGPALADPAPPPLEAYGGLPGVEDMALSPNGEGVAIVGRVGTERRLLIFGPEEKLRAAAPLGDAKLRYIRWAGNDLVVAVTSVTEGLGPGFTTDKAEFQGAALVPADGSKIAWVFGNRPSMAKAIFGNYGIRHVGNRWLGYFGGVELKPTGDRLSYTFDHGRPALFGVDLKQNTTQRVSPSPSESIWRDWLVDGNGTAAATLDINHRTGGWKIVNYSGTALASGIDPTGDVSLISFNRDGSGAVYSTEDQTSGHTRWFEVPLAGGASSEILAGVDIDRLYLDPASGRMLGYLEGGAERRPVLFDPRHQAAIGKVFKAFPKLDVQVVEWTPDFSHVLVKTSGNEDSGSWYIVDLGKLRADPIGTDYPLIPPAAVGAISSFAYKASDGLELDGVLTLPPGRKASNLPVIMLPHGGPNAHDRVAFDWWAQAFASRGYAVFQPNFRGSTNRDDAFRRAGNGQWGRKMQSDISDGLTALAQHGIVDPGRACIVGASYGGYAALAGVTLQQDIYRCAVAVAPVSDLGDMYWTDYRESGQNRMIKRSRRESLGDPSSFAAVSPRRHAGQADAPILLIHGKDDTVVPFRHSDAMAGALRGAGKPHELVILREEDHWLSRAATRRQMLEASVRFVGQHNPAD